MGTRTQAVVDELVAAARAARDGQGSLFVLTGEAGIGKTSAARALVAAVRDEMTVTWGGCRADRAAPPFWPWRDAVAYTDDAPRPLGTETSADAIGAQRFGRLSELRDSLFAAADSAPRLHVIEDVQWADVASVLLLEHAGAALANVPLLLVATLRTGETMSPLLHDALEDVQRVAQVRAVPPLDAAGVEALLREAGVAADAELAALVRKRTGGNPFFVTELLRSLRADADLVVELGGDVPARVAELVAHRLNRLPDAVSGLVKTAATMGTSGDVRTLTSATGCTPESVVDLLEQARAAQLLEVSWPNDWHFRHDLVRDAIYATLRGDDRARFHAVVLDALAADPATPPPLLAHHALAGAPAVDPDRAVALAARAGESALAQHAYEEAVVWFARALDAAGPTGAPRWRAELLVRRGEASRQSGDLDGARVSFAAAADVATDPSLLARAALGFADPGADLCIAYRTRDVETVPLLERAIAAQPAGDSVMTVLLEARLASELYFSDEPARSRVLADTALARARRIDDPLALAVAAAVHHDAFGVGQGPHAEQLAASAQVLQWARDSRSTGALLAAHRARVIDLLAAGDLAEMDREIVAFRRLADPLDVAGYAWWPALWSAMRALLDGNHDVAEQRGLEAFALGEGPFPSLAMFNLSFLLFFLRREQGRLDELEQPTRDAVAANADVPAIRVALALLVAELGRADEGAAVANALRDGNDFGALRDRNWPASWFQLARVAFLARDNDLAAALLADGNQPDEPVVQVSLGTVCLGATDLGRAWLHHALGARDEAAARYAAAEATNARIGARRWLAQAQADHASLVGAPTSAAAGPPTAAGTFRRDGKVWHIAFAGREASVAHGRGLLDLQTLLMRPHVAVSVLEFLDDGAGATDRGSEVFDERARREIRAHLKALDDEEADAEAAGDGERAALARDKRQDLAEAIARDFGLGGKSRRVGDSVERARKTVSTRIRRTIAQVGKTHPELGRHLDRSIDTGAWCAYRPAEPVSWNF